MKTFNQFLITELFDSGYSYKWDMLDPIAYASTPNGKLEIFFDEMDEDDGIWEVHFEVGGKKVRTNKGDAPAIFATVLNATKDFVKTVPSAKELVIKSEKEKVKGRSTNPDSRAKLYAALAKRYAGKMGFKIAQISNTSSGSTIHLKRTKK